MKNYRNNYTSDAATVTAAAQFNRNDYLVYANTAGTANYAAVNAANCTSATPCYDSNPFAWDLMPITGAATFINNYARYVDDGWIYTRGADGAGNFADTDTITKIV